MKVNLWRVMEPETGRVREYACNTEEAARAKFMFEYRRIPFRHFATQDIHVVQIKEGGDK